MMIDPLSNYHLPPFQADSGLVLAPVCTILPLASKRCDQVVHKTDQGQSIDIAKLHHFNGLEMAYFGA